jgi:uncharacterized protein
VTASQQSGFLNSRILKFNVGFLLAQSAGYQRATVLDLPRVRLADDLDLDYLQGELRFSRNSRGILVQGILETSVFTECSRCLSLFYAPVTVEIEELFEDHDTSLSSLESSSDAVYRVEETGMLDLAPLLREEVFLAVPMGLTCQPDCAGLCPECGQNLNEGTCNCMQDEIDPRFAVLAQLIEDDNE